MFKENEKTGNLIGLLIGIALLLGCQNILDFNLIWKLALPTVLVIIGLSIVFKNTLGGKINNEIKKLNEKRSGENSYCATFSGTLDEQKLETDRVYGTGANYLEIDGGIGEIKIRTL